MVGAQIQCSGIWDCIRCTNIYEFAESLQSLQLLDIQSNTALISVVGFPEGIHDAAIVLRLPHILFNTLQLGVNALDPLHIPHHDIVPPQLEKGRHVLFEGSRSVALDELGGHRDIGVGVVLPPVIERLPFMHSGLTSHLGERLSQIIPGGHLAGYVQGLRRGLGAVVESVSDEESDVTQRNQTDMAVLDWRREDVSAICSLVQRCEEELDDQPRSGRATSGGIRTRMTYMIKHLHVETCVDHTPRQRRIIDHRRLSFEPVCESAFAIEVVDHIFGIVSA